MNTAVAKKQDIANLAVPTKGEQDFALVQRRATALSQSSIVPEHFRGKKADCIIVINMADRLGADPLMVAQNLYIVHGKPGWSSQFLIATFNQSPDYGPLRYELRGKENTDAWSCRAVAREKETGDKLEGPWVSIAMAKAEGWFNKKGSKWQTMPEHMLRFRAAAFFIRTTAPEISMGLHTAEELHDVIDVTPNANGVFEQEPQGVADKLNAFADAGSEPEPAIDQPTAVDAEIVEDDAQTSNDADHDFSHFWQDWIGAEPMQDSEVFDDMDRQLKLVESVVSIGALHRVFATQAPAISNFDQKDQLLLRGAYNRRAKEIGEADASVDVSDYEQ